jgi:polysaccharide export outer membrane protein
MIFQKLLRFAQISLLNGLLLFVPQVIAASAPTPEQMRLFQQLTPEQQQQAIEAYQSGQAATANVTEKPITEQPTTQAPTEPGSVQPRAVDTNKRIEKTIEEGTNAPTLKEAPETKAIEQPPLKQFGYDLFAGTPTTFAPATDIPIPSDYIIGPGDNIQIQLFGKDNAEYDLVVSREGLLRFPDLGPISVAGLRFDELKKNLQDRIARQMIGVKADITMGALRSIRIFVLGDAVRPGSYTVSALSSMTNALFVSGGIKPIGSLRNIQLKRNGKIITNLDLYDLLLHGDTSHDKRLQPGDVIFIPPIGKTVGVAGEVHRPAIYELKKKQTVRDALAFAGGTLPTAYPKVSQLERITSNGERTLLDIDATNEKDLNKPLRDGDVIRVYSILEKMENIVLLSGYVQRPGGVQWHEGMRLLDVVPSINDLLPKPDLEYVIIKREVQPDRHIEVITTRYSMALKDKSSDYNTLLKPRDEIIFFGLDENRQTAISEIIDHLKKQERFDHPALVVGVYGNVRYPGEYPYSKHMRVTDLLRAAYDIKPRTDLNYAVLTKEQLGGASIYTKVISLKNIIYRAGAVEDLELNPKDNLYIFGMEDSRQELLKPVLDQLKTQATNSEPAQVVSINGLVKEPGNYPLVKNMVVADLVAAAGGLSESAYSMGAELSRFQVVDGQYREIKHYKISQSQLFDHHISKKLKLTPFDRLQIKRIPLWTEQQSIELRGEVKFPGVYTFHRGETLKDVVERAGGLTDQAFPEGAVFTREELRIREQQQIDQMAARLESDLAAVTLEQSQSQTQTANKPDVQSVALANSLLKQLKQTKAMGRLVINLKGLLSSPDQGTGFQHIILKDGDKLIVPQKTQEVTIIGEVQKSTSHLYSPDLNRDDYINLSGGTTYKADKDRIYTVRANGAVVSEENTKWYQNSEVVEPGDTIVVPLNAERLRPLTLWTNVTQIIYQLGISAAAWQTVGVL